MPLRRKARSSTSDETKPKRRVRRKPAASGRTAPSVGIPSGAFSCRQDLPSSATRDAHPSGFPFVYGRKPVLEILRHSPGRVLQVFIVSGLNSGVDSFPPHVEVVYCPEKKALSQQFGVLEHQGVVATLTPRKNYSISELVDTCDERSLLVALDQVSDPQNMGSIYRAVDSAGCRGVIGTKAHCAPLNSTVAKASIGASELVPTATVGNLAQALERLKKHGFWVVGTALGSGSKNLFEVKLPRPAVVVLGSEEKGLRRLTIEKCDLLLEIPLYGRMQSLNVGQAAGIVLFEYVRQGNA